MHKKEVCSSFFNEQKLRYHLVETINYKGKSRGRREEKKKTKTSMYSHFRNEIWIYDVVLCVCTCPKKEYSLAGRRYSSAYAQSSSTDRLGINLKSWDGYEFQNYERRARGGGGNCARSSQNSSLKKFL